jgi:hypothetical protein
MPEGRVTAGLWVRYCGLFEYHHREEKMEWLDQKVLRQLADDIGHEMMPVVISVFVEEVGEQLPN